MPRVIIRSEPRSPEFDRLVSRLAEELKNPSPGPQPLIVEQEVSATRSRHVQVIWDQWKKLPDEQRTDVILEAYRQAEGAEYADQITIMNALTGAEALTLGLLPWKVEPNLSKSGGPSEADYGRALQKEEKQTVLGAGSVMRYGALRYARKEDAEEALRRLKALLPKSSWTVSQDVYAD